MKGYMVKRGTRRVRGSDKHTSCWRLFVELGRRADGKRERRTKTVYGTERDAAKELRSLLREHDAGVRSNPSQLDVEHFLRRWFATKTDLELGTREDYEAVIEQRLIPAFGKLKLDRLDRQVIRAQYSRWLAEGRLPRKSKKPHKAKRASLSSATIRKIHTVLRGALQSAFDDNLVVRNMAAGLELPKLAVNERRALCADEFKALLIAASSSRMYAPILTLLATGLRRGELLALRWKDLDLDRRRLAVRRSLESTKGALRFKAPKTAKTRVVTLPEIAIDALVAHRVWQNKERLRMGEAWVDNDLVFAGFAGGPWEPHNFSRDFRKCAIAAGIGSIGSHILRHTAATEMLRQGLHPKVVADRLGHATTRMTLDIYSHMSPDLESDAAARMNVALNAALAEKALPA